MGLSLHEVRRVSKSPYSIYDNNYPSHWDFVGCECFREGDLARAALGVLGLNLSIAGGLELQRRYGRWDREGFWRDKP